MEYCSSLCGFSLICISVLINILLNIKRSNPSWDEHTLMVKQLRRGTLSLQMFLINISDPILAVQHVVAERISLTQTHTYTTHLQLSVIDTNKENNWHTYICVRYTPKAFASGYDGGHQHISQPCATTHGLNLHASLFVTQCDPEIRRKMQQNKKKYFKKNNRLNK